jgi:2-oxoglutarate dehydrogenase E2 component (dihydrolipoamide succinyltransferase)
MALELKVPEVGESITEVIIGRWLKSPGQPVQKDEGVVEIETDKVTLELPAPGDGQVSQQLKQQGDEATVGEAIGYMEEGAAGGDGGEAAQPQQAGGEAEATPTSEAREPAAAEHEPAGQPNEKAAAEDRLMPAARRLVDQHRLDPARIEGTGKGGRVLKQDVQRYLQQQDQATAQAAAAQGQAAPPQPEAPAPSAEEPAPEPAAAEQRGEDVVPMSPMRRRIASRLVEVQQTAALLTTFNEVDMSQVMALRSQYKDQFQEEYDAKLGFMSFFVKAVIDALKRFPAINAEIRENQIAYKNYYDIGIAVSTDKGLVVPVLRSAERMSFAEIESKIVDFGKRAQNNQLTLDELQGGSFTITNGGVFGSLLSTPIVNPPQSAVLGMHAIKKRPVAVGDNVEVRPMMYIALTYDHRIVDGREAVTFLRRIKEAVEEPTRMLMEV